MLRRSLSRLVSAGPEGGGGGGKSSGVLGLVFWGFVYLGGGFGVGDGVAAAALPPRSCRRTAAAAPPALAKPQG